jgi:hypothetical protein
MNELVGGYVEKMLIKQYEIIEDLVKQGFCVIENNTFNKDNNEKLVYGDISNPKKLLNIKIIDNKIFFEIEDFEFKEKR